MELNTLENKDLRGKTVLLRTDLNMPVEDGKPQKTVRFKRYLETIEYLNEKGARTVIMAHQGRPARKDFLSLEEHGKMLTEELGEEVNFVESFFGQQLGDAVASMQNGDTTLLQNIRFLSEELQSAPPKKHSQDYFVQKMGKYFDIYVDDAFSAAHRSHGSMVGFTELMDSHAGLIMERELKNCGKVKKEFEDGVLVLGGEKPSDIIGMLEHMIEDVEKVLLGGIPGELALMIKGYDLGEKAQWIQEKGFNTKEEKFKEILETHKEKIILPEDLVTDSGTYKPQEIPENELTWDIGNNTVQKYVEIIENAESVVMKGPMGAFEEHEEGTREVVVSIAESDAYTVLGGGHTSSLVQRFDKDLKDFDHVSIAGGAFVRFMSGEELPAVEVLRK